MYILKDRFLHPIIESCANKTESLYATSGQIKQSYKCSKTQNLTDDHFTVTCVSTRGATRNVQCIPVTYLHGPCFSLCGTYTSRIIYHVPCIE